MQKWEYKVITNLANNEKGKEIVLNKLGAEGWELVCIDDAWYIFKRLVETEREFSELEWQISRAIVPECDA